MAGPDFLSQLPSLDELLENPRVKAAVDRFNQAEAVSRVRGAMTGLVAEVTRAAEGVQSLAPAEVLDRVVRRISQPIAPARSGNAINATGDLFTSGWSAPLPPAAIQAIEGAATSGLQVGQTSLAIKSLLSSTGEVFPSHVSAISVVLEALASGGVCVIGRPDMAQLAPGVRFDDLCRRANVQVREVGATDTASIEDYAATLESIDGPAIVWRRMASPGEPDLASLAALARSKSALLVVDCHRAAPTSDSARTAKQELSVQAALEARADVALLDASGLIGGPVAGLVVGGDASIKQVRESNVAKASPVAGMIDHAVAATLHLFQEPTNLRFTHPVYQLLDAPQENLKVRAERLAPQIAASPHVNSAEAIELVEDRSWAIRVEGDVSQLGRLLESSEPAVLAKSNPDALLLDLQMVYPREDRLLIAALVGDEPPTG